jgi:hypothetical protein
VRLAVLDPCRLQLHWSSPRAGTAPAAAMRGAVWRAARLSTLRAALMLAALAAAMRHAMFRAAPFSCLVAALVFAPPASAMHDAALRADSSSSLGAAQVLTAPASAVRDAMLRAWCSSPRAAHVLAALATAMHHCMRYAVRRAASSSSIGAARVLAPPPSAMCDAMLRTCRNQQQRRCSPRAGSACPRRAPRSDQ